MALWNEKGSFMQIPRHTEGGGKGEKKGKVNRSATNFE